MKKGGFTLVEIMVVVALIGMLAAVAIPNFQTAYRNARISLVRANLETIRRAIDAQNLASGSYPPFSDVNNNLGKIIRGDALPDNPFSTQNKWNQTNPRNIVYDMSGSTKGTLAWGGGLGWCYNEQTGEFWANTRTSGVNENEF